MGFLLLTATVCGGVGLGTLGGNERCWAKISAITGVIAVLANLGNRYCRLQIRFRLGDWE